MMWEQIGTKALDFLGELIVSVGMKLLYAVTLLFLGSKLIRFLVKRFRQSRGYQRMDPSVARFLASAIHIFLKVILFVSAAMILGVPSASFLTVLTSAGVAIGLALQGSLANFAGGIMILLFKPFHPGDYIECGDISGTVEEISIFYTTLVTPDGRAIHAPNGALSDTNITNYSEKDTRRVDISLPCDYSADIRKAKKSLLLCASDNKKVLSDPPAVVYVTDYKDSAVVLTLRAYCRNTDYWDVRFALTEAAKEAFARSGIRIPFPQLDIHIRDAQK